MAEVAYEAPLTHGGAAIDLFWIPLGAGGRGFVRLNGRVYEAVTAGLERRRRLDLYHGALQIRIPEGRFTVEMTPIPKVAARPRGVAVEGPVGSRFLARFRVFRYEIRCWRDGVIPDADEVVDGPRRLSADPDAARRLLDLTASVPPLVWGRDELGVGEMWNSNSVVSWLLASTGLPTDRVLPPSGGRAPGWAAGLVAAGGVVEVPGHRRRPPGGRPGAAHPPGREGPPVPVRGATPGPRGAVDAGSVR